jgi:hypothetical protein
MVGSMVAIRGWVDWWSPLRRVCSSLASAMEGED